MDTVPFQWAWKAFLALLLFFLLSNFLLPTLVVEKGSYSERVSIPYTPEKVRLHITLREESSTRDFPFIGERLNEIKDYVENYSILPRMYHYKDEAGETVYVLTYEIDAVMDIDEVALSRIVALADALSATFVYDEKTLEEKALNASTWEPEGLVLKHEKEAQCSFYHPVPIMKANADIVPREEERECTIRHTYERVKVEWKTLYQLLQGILPHL